MVVIEVTEANERIGSRLGGAAQVSHRLKGKAKLKEGQELEGAAG